MMTETGCDGVMIGRGAYGRPWVFSEIIAKCEGREYKEPSNEEKRTILIEQLETAILEKGDNGIKEFRHHLLQYCKGFSGSARMRRDISLITSRRTVMDAIERIFNEP